VSIRALFGRINKISCTRYLAGRRSRNQRTKKKKGMFYNFKYLEAVFHKTRYILRNCKVKR
jgi:hypothetical protein